MGGPCTLRLQVDARRHAFRDWARLCASPPRLLLTTTAAWARQSAIPVPLWHSRREYLSAKSEPSLVALHGSAANNVVKNPFTNSNPITSPHQSCHRARAQRPRTTATRATPVVSSAKSSVPQSLSSSTLASSTRVGSHVLSRSRLDYGLSLGLTTESRYFYRVHFRLHSYVIVLSVS
jgi:hypothetical protein